jgi:hypothetical protein
MIQHQRVMIHTRAFVLNAGAAVEELLGSVVTEKNMHVMNGKSAIVQLRYDSGGSLTNIAVSTDSPELRSLLEPLNWRDFPLPASHALRLSGLDIEITMSEHRPGITFVTYF